MADLSDLENIENVDNEIIELDARRLLCPMPVIKLQNKIKTVAPGAKIRILCTDPGTRHDIPTWCRLYQHSILAIEENDDEIHFLVQAH